MHIKTGFFYLCIADPGNQDAVVIDRHAYDIAVREIYGQRDRGLGAVGRYNMLADCYRAAAQEIGEVPSKVQAVTWVAHIECDCEVGGWGGGGGVRAVMFGVF